ncbi:DUF2169 family type VI secretion system accessory protein [Erwinia tasmaniensis]|uniref:DUF2169 domain-containing protein n=1 Tax=Erwinia tasmaniensis (strain DSM 17950 / CFBP 7177 / CIP 109463 / NCPPB 4357 / Et1/99) TaxID=465817 RepID=B2VH63_ERWT9|nr:DUF2169 domain-containing protein [Erwinia tasmaniensis]CAO95688.1 Hypothetical protein ETA_06420 [Erwinia tasmaniensis Et1/99]
MQNFINLTPFPALQFESLDQQDHGFTSVVARLSYDLDIHSGTLRLCKEQGELVEQDEYFGETGRSSTRFESDLAPYKPRLDVVINATAWAPQDNAVKSFTAGIRIGEATRLIRIFGAREWRKMIASWQLGEAKPIASLDLRYEYAVGGFYQPAGAEPIASPANTVGMGWYPRAILKQTKVQRLPAPQIEWVTHPVENIDRAIAPAGFGFYGRGWQGRIEHAGSYDQAWQRDRHPLLPQDFSFDYWNGAHPWLQFPLPEPLKRLPVSLRYLVAASEVADQQIHLSVPVESLFIFLTTEQGAGVAQDMRLDTLVIDLPTRKIHCSYRTVVSELMSPVMTELRFIAEEERQQQQMLAARLNGDPHSSGFVPLPPSLLKQRQPGEADG